MLTFDDNEIAQEALQKPNNRVQLADVCKQIAVTIFGETLQGQLPTRGATVATSEKSPGLDLMVRSNSIPTEDFMNDGPLKAMENAADSNEEREFVHGLAGHMKFQLRAVHVILKEIQSCCKDRATFILTQKNWEPLQRLVEEFTPKDLIRRHKQFVADGLPYAKERTPEYIVSQAVRNVFISKGIITKDQVVAPSISHGRPSRTDVADRKEIIAIQGAVVDASDVLIELLNEGKK